VSDDCLEIIVATKIKELREGPTARLGPFGVLLGKRMLPWASGFDFPLDDCWVFPQAILHSALTILL
jgi:hypothetical protein